MSLKSAFRTIETKILEKHKIIIFQFNSLQKLEKIANKLKIL